MAESNPIQVILTDDGIKIIKAQKTADNAAGGVTNLNDPNLMNVIEKQNNVVQFSGLTSQYKVLMQNAKDDGIDTTSVTTAYNNLNQFMASVLADPGHASDVDRVAYKKCQDAYNQELANLQNALQNYANSEFASAASAASQASMATSQAFSAASSAHSQAQAISDRVDSEITVQSTATSQAQSAADSAFSQAKDALDTGNAVSQAVIDLKDGSTLTIAELGSGVATKISSSEFASYKTQTDSQVAEMVTSGAFTAYSQATAELISDKVANSEFTSYKEETASGISSMVKSSDFNSYKDQTDKAFEDTVSSEDYKSDKKQTANMISDTVSDAINGLTISNRNLALGTVTAFTITGNTSGNKMYSLSSTIANGTTVTVSFDITSTNATGDYGIQFIGGTWQTVTGVDDFNGLPLFSGTQHLSYTFKTEADYSDGVQLRLDNSTSTVTVSNFIISESSKEVSWTPAPEDQATESQFTQLKGDIDLRVKKGDLISDINVNPDNIIISTDGKLVLSGKNINFDSDNPVIIPSANIDKLLVGKNLKTADISANTFTTNNGTFTVDKYGLVTATSLVIRGTTNLVYNAALAGNNGSSIPGWNISNNGICWQNVTHDGVPSIGFNNTAVGWTMFAQTKLYPLNGVTGQPFSASVWFKEDGSDTSLQYGFNLSFFDSNGNRISAFSPASGNWNGISSGQDWSYVTINNAVAPSNAVSVGLQYWAYNGHGNACFSQPMLTQTANAMGYQPDTGNVVSAGEIDGSVINGAIINTPNLVLGDNGQITGGYSVNDDISWFQPINGTGELHISNGYIQSSAKIIYYNKLLQGIGGDKWGHWASSSQFVPAPDQAHPDTSNVAESTLTPAFLKLDIFSADKSSVVSRAYIDGTGLYINDGGSESIVSMLSDYELVSNGMAYLNTGIQMKQDASFTFGNLAMSGYHSISMLDGQALYFTENANAASSPIEIVAKTFTKASRLSIKHDITPLSTAESSRLLNAIDVEKFRYITDNATFKYQYGGVIDDINSLGSKQYSMPPELLNEDGTGINLDSLTGILIKRVQDQDKMIGELSMRLTKLEMEK